MIATIIKRDKSREAFDLSKVVSAVQKAYESTGEPVPDDLASQLAFVCGMPDLTTVEQIQDTLERFLFAQNFKVGKAFMLYRQEHKMIRDGHNKIVQSIAAKLRAENVENQNANVDEYSFGGRVGEASDVVTKKFALDNIVSKMAKRNHEGNMIYIHDLSAYSDGRHNCMSEPIDDLLKNGFSVRQCDIRGAKSVSTALQLVAVLFQVQSLEQFGGVSATHLDWSLVPYLRMSFTKYFKNGLKWLYLDKSDVVEKFLENKKNNKPELTPYEEAYLWNDNVITMDDVELRELYPTAWDYAIEYTKQELEQAVEGMYHNLNSLQSRSGSQLPFSSINYGTCTLPEGRMIIEAILEGSIKGVGKFHRTPIFPCGIFKLQEGVNRRPGDPNYYLFRKALESTSKRLYPNYANVDWSGNAGWDPQDPRTEFSTMGCRTANGWDINGLGQLKDGRGNICPVTIIMPTLAMMAGRDVEKFMKLLDKKIGEAKDMLLERFEWIASQSPKSAPFMYGNHVMAGYVPEEGIRSALRHGTLALGSLGLNETLMLLIGKNHTTEEGMELAKRIYGLFKQRCAEYKEQYKLNVGVYLTPAENLCFTAMKKFRGKYGIIEGVSDKEYFTNSIHVPVYDNVTPFEKIDIESQLTGYSSAGCITYVELPSTVNHNLDALETLVNYAMDKDIPYFAINVPVDNCECGASGEFGETCPECGSSHIQRLRRVTGYLTGDYKTAFNWGKQKETEARVKHTSQEVEI